MKEMIYLEEDVIKSMMKHEHLNDIIDRVYVSENILREHSDILDWNTDSGKQILSEKFIEDFSDRLNWKFILLNENIDKSISFIRKFIDHIDWFWVSMNPPKDINEDFLNEFINEIGDCLSYFQKSVYMSEEFIIDNIGKLSISYLFSRYAGRDWSDAMKLAFIANGIEI